MNAKTGVDRSALPLFDPRHKLKLGLFSFNVSGGMMATSVPTSYELTWEHTRRIARQADAMIATKTQPNASRAIRPVCSHVSS